jgi:hypothetical protein
MRWRIPHAGCAIKVANSIACAQKKGAPGTNQELYNAFFNEVLLLLLCLCGWLRSDEHELLARLTNTQLRSQQIQLDVSINR